MAIRLKNWKMKYVKPYEIEAVWSLAEGDVYGHPKFEDGARVVTSYIIKTENHDGYMEATTFSGSVYHLYEEDEYSETEEG